MTRTSNARKQNSAAISHPSLLTECQMALAVTSGLSGTARPVGWSLTATNAQDQVNSERGGPSPYRAVEPWLLLLYMCTDKRMHVRMVYASIIYSLLFYLTLSRIFGY
jgi:hypothetical protein